MFEGLEFRPEAKCDAEEAIRYYERRVPGLGSRFQAELMRVCAMIAKQPDLWRTRPGGYRRANIPGYPYYVAFFVRDSKVLVAAVAHASRDPDYWKKREL